TTHFRVATKIQEVRKGTTALEAAQAQGEHARTGQPLIIAGVAVEGLSRQRVRDLRRHIVGKPHRAASAPTELAEHRRFLNKRRGEWQQRAVPEVLLTESLLVILLGRLLQERIVVLLLRVQHAT